MDPDKYFGGMEEGNPDDLEDVDSVAEDTKKRRLKSPIKLRWLEPLVKLAITEKPNISNKEMAGLLKPYVNKNFLTDSLLQTTHISVREIVFGDPNQNIQFLDEFCNRLDTLGHGYNIITKSPREVKSKLEEIVLAERLQKAKRDGEKMKRDQQNQFVKDWKLKHKDMLEESGLEGGLVDKSHKFVSGVFMCTSAAKNTVPLIQTVYQADAAHMKFGKYTLYTCMASQQTAMQFLLRLG